MPSSRRNRNLVVMLVGLALATLMIYWPRAPGEAPSGAPEPSQTSRSSEPRPVPDATAIGAKRIDEERWRRLREALERARAARAEQAAVATAAAGQTQSASAQGAPLAPPTAPAASAPPEPLGTLGREYIQQAIRGITPLIHECYELALDQDPSLEGRLRVEFWIGGEPDVGGIVEEANIANGSTLRHPVLDECVRETIYTVEFPPPEGGGRVRVTYPFTFTRSPPQPVAAPASQGGRLPATGSH